MIIASRIKLLASVFAYGCIVLTITPVAAIAARHRHHSVSSDNTHSRHHESRHNSREIDAELISQRHHLDRMLREQHLEVLAMIHQFGSLRRAYLHRVHIAQEQARQERVAAAAQHRWHVARANEFRKERLAELNGEISSKSIRAWQAYVLNTPVRLISVDLNDPKIKVNVLLAENGIGSAEPFSQMIRRTQPDVAVTGTFFSLDSLRPVGDIVANGEVENFGGMGTALCITPQNKADMITVPWGHHHDWTGYSFVMACGPRLLCNNNIVLDPATERFNDRSMLAPNSRIGVGITPGNKLIFVMTEDSIYLGRLAKIMRAIGCSQAMNLDAGASTGFYCDGNMMARPGRWLTNAIVVYANQHVAQSAS